MSVHLNAGGTINPSRFVMLDVSNAFVGLQATAGAGIMGISHESTRTAPVPDTSASQTHCISGEPIGLYDDNEICLLEIGDTVAVGDKLKSDANGKGIPVDTTSGGYQEVGAVAVQGGSSGDKIKVKPLPNGVYYS
jgi:hypothetical protein